LAMNTEPLSKLQLLRSEVPPPRKTRFTLQELRDHDFPPPRWAVPDLLPEGLTILAGPPKSGKSYLALQIAGAVASGGNVLERKPVAGCVLYLALEDSGARVKERIRQQQWLTANADGFELVLEWPTVKQGGFEQLSTELERGTYRLVVLDTLGKLLAGSGRDLDKYGDMTDTVGALQTLALKTNTAVLAIHHHRKLKSGNLVEDGLGSIGINAAADAIAGLYRKGTHWQLQIVGRDLEELTIALERDPVTRTWQRAADEYGIRPGTWQARILEVLKAGSARHKTLKSALQIDGSLLSRMLGELVEKGAVIQRRGGLYEVNTHN